MHLTEQLTSEFKDTVSVVAASSVDAIDGVFPEAVATPQSEEAAVALVAWCGRESVAFVPRGSGSRLGVGAKPSRCELIISTLGLTGIVEHDDGNATVCAQAGIRLAELNARVGERKQFVPLDNAMADTASTLGGAIASNTSGMSRLKYGAPRDLVVGLHAVLSDGRLVKAGSKVVKNVSGYDLNKLFIGSFGSLGLVTEVTIRLRPRDLASATWRGHYLNWEAATEQARAILDGAFVPTALRLTAVNGHIEVLAQFDGVESAVNVQLSRLPASTEGDGLHFDTTASAVVLRAGLPLQSARDWARTAEAAGAGNIAWDYGTGTIIAAFAACDDPAALVGNLREKAVAADGFVVAERLPAEIKTAELVWGAAGGGQYLLGRLKAKYDAAEVCAPGRLVGGL